MSSPKVATPLALGRLALGWIVLLLAPLIPDHPATPATLAILAALIGVIILCSFGVVAQAEGLARRLGDPYGTLILTLSIVIIEVVLISAVMLGPGHHAEIARDSIMTVSMIIMNLVAGIALIIMAARRSSAAPNPAGIRAYVWRIMALGALAFLVPVAFTYTPVQSIAIAVTVAIFYSRFLYLQLGRRHRDYQETSTSPNPASATEQPPRTSVTRAPEVPLRAFLLLATAVPIVILAHDMASLLELTAERFTLPTALPAAIIATIVFLPETITTFKAAHRGEPQRVSNLCHGALLSSFGLTIPSVLMIGVLTNQDVVLAESTANLVIFGATMALTLATFRGTPRIAGGLAHLILFGFYTAFTFVL
ncbi:MAG: calcium:proton antiporter [Ancrocorticia sp.]|uniref:calcium:proton antiporter n=1 Tax=Ancrocorticia sp. TaxID=2593684 RepID=UPI003F9062C5